MDKFVFVLFLFLVGCVSTEFSTIRGKKTDSVREIKGVPATIIRENGYEMWTYRRGECRQIVFFDENEKAVDWYESDNCVVPQ